MGGILKQWRVNSGQWTAPMLLQLTTDHCSLTTDNCFSAASPAEGATHGIQRQGNRPLQQPAQCGPTGQELDRGRHGSGGRAGVRRRDAAADPRQPRDPGHRRSQVQDLWLRLGDCQLFAGHRVDQGPHRGRCAGHQEHRHREGTLAAAGEDSLFGAGRGCDSRGHRRLEEEERRCGDG